MTANTVEIIIIKHDKKKEIMFDCNMQFFKLTYVKLFYEYYNRSLFTATNKRYTILSSGWRRKNNADLGDKLTPRERGEKQKKNIAPDLESARRVDTLLEIFQGDFVKMKMKKKASSRKRTGEKSR